MRLHYLWLPVLLLAAACKQKDKNTEAPPATGSKNGITIQLQVSGADTGKVMFMYEDDNGARQNDTALLAGGQCKHVIPVSSTRNVYTSLGDDGTFLYLQPGTVQLSGHIDSMFLGYMYMQGDAISNEARSYYMNATQFIRDRFADFSNIRKIRNSGQEANLQSLVGLGRQMNIEKQRADSAFAAQYPQHAIMAALVYEKYTTEGGAVTEVEHHYNNLDETVKQGFYGKKLQQLLTQARKTESGNTAMDFVLNDINGEQLSLASYKGKYVLVDFWASWCRPCRAENPHVVEAYNHFKGKNFDIIGVSLDEDFDKWAEAIEQDGLAWRHVSDLKGWNSDVARLYGVQSIPANFLLDPGGRIIARDLRGPDLVKELQRVLK